MKESLESVTFLDLEHNEYVTVVKVENESKFYGEFIAWALPMGELDNYGEIVLLSDCLNDDSMVKKHCHPYDCECFDIQRKVIPHYGREHDCAIEVPIVDSSEVISFKKQRKFRGKVDELLEYYAIDHPQFKNFIKNCKVPTDKIKKNFYCMFEILIQSDRDILRELDDWIPKYISLTSVCEIFGIDQLPASGSSDSSATIFLNAIVKLAASSYH